VKWWLKSGLGDREMASFNPSRSPDGFTSCLRLV
jgi:hypothetical protein